MTCTKHPHVFIFLIDDHAENKKLYKLLNIFFEIDDRAENERTFKSPETGLSRPASTLAENGFRYTGKGSAYTVPKDLYFHM